MDLSKNRLQRLPDDFGNLNKLVRLDLYGNQLKTLPITFGQLAKLKWLDLKDNPLEPTLRKYAGDCTNQKQCQLCALNCVKFMKYEKTRIEAEKRVNEEKLRQRLEYERRVQDKNQKEKERKKAKNVRRSARKAQQRVDQQDNSEDNEDEEEEMREEKDDNQQKSKSSFFGSVFALIWLLIRISLFVSIISISIFIGLSIGLHLQSGHRLESLEDIKTALSNCLRRIENLEQFNKDLVLLIDLIVKNLKNSWKTNWNSFVKQENKTKAWELFCDQNKNFNSDLRI